MIYQDKHPNTVTVAIARELAGHLWNALQATTPARSSVSRTPKEWKTADEDRHDPEPPRYRYADGTKSVPDPRP